MDLLNLSDVIFGESLHTPDMNSRFAKRVQRGSGRIVGKQEIMRLWSQNPLHATTRSLQYECWAIHAAGVSSGRRWIGRSANPGCLVLARSIPPNNRESS